MASREQDITLAEEPGEIASSEQPAAFTELPSEMAATPPAAPEPCGDWTSEQQARALTDEPKEAASTAQGRTLTEDPGESALPEADEPCKGAFVDEDGEAICTHAACAIGGFTVATG